MTKKNDPLLERKDPSDIAWYFAESLNWRTYECEAGFIVYEYLPDNVTVYIREIYVKPEYRRQKYASQLADIVCYLAKNSGCTKMLGSVTLVSNHVDASIKTLYGYGMKFLKAEPGLLFFSKEID